MTRPKAEIPPTVHGAMKEFADRESITVERAYIVAAKLILNLDDHPESDYAPNGDPVLGKILANVDREPGCGSSRSTE